MLPLLRTIAYPRPSVASGESARRRPATASSVLRFRSRKRTGARASLAASASTRSRERARPRFVSRSSAALRASSRPRSSLRSCTTSLAAAVGRGGPDVRREVAERRVLLVADRAHHRDAAAGERPHDPLVAPRKQVLEAPAAASHHDDVDARLAGQLGEGRHDPGRCLGALDVRLGHQHVHSRKPCRHRGDEVALRCGLVSGQQPDPAGKGRQRALPSRLEQAFSGQRALQPLDPRQDVAEPDGLDRERAELEDAAGRVEVGPPVDVDTVTVRRGRGGGRRTRPGAWSRRDTRRRWGP